MIRTAARYLVPLALALTAFGTTVAPLTASAAEVVIVAPSAPPPVRYEVVPALRVGYVWDRGHWNWEHGRYVWIGGHWEAERVGLHWAPGHWAPRGPNWVWVRGHWA
ncbi:YXWGXW repeat-containing protein [Burkholderia gladioli]|uniref:YXWGXW repeat-containing protein n=1 Tax=Burkholderia gladioli TaxID=28095 RepID=UPI00163E910B|nr:YXWGXW repeat-containing protein [Burkholderia gladioli]